MFCLANKEQLRPSNSAKGVSRVDGCQHHALCRERQPKMHLEAIMQRLVQHPVRLNLPG